MSIIDVVKNKLEEYAEPDRVEKVSGYFQSYSGGYGEGDVFLGIRVPNQRKVARKYYQKVTLDEIEKLLNDKIHEYRLTALFLLINKYEKVDADDEIKNIVDLYLKNISQVNNWDLVDSSAPQILGPYFLKRNKELLYDFVDSGDLWKQRIAIMTTFYFIKNESYADTLNMVESCLDYEHDLIHKACGWMLREIGKRDFETEYDFLAKYYQDMPRTMLRYAIEKFEEELRQQFLQGEISM